MKKIVLAIALLWATAAQAADVTVNYQSGTGPQQVSPTFPLPITAVGATSNASSGVATGSTSISGVSYNYGFNGATWDQLQVDASKNLKTFDAADFAASPTNATGGTRASNTTTYTANTGWCLVTSSCTTVFSWTAACRANGGNVLITGFDVYSSANPTLKLSGVLWLFSATPGTVMQDNATFNIASADFANLLGGFYNGQPFTLATAQGSGATNSGTSVTGLNAQVACGGSTTTIYGMVEVANAYVPASAEVLTVKLHTIALQ